MKSTGSILLLLISSAAMSQGLYNRGAIISISSQTIVSIPDSLVNEGTLINNGELQIAGSWLNQGTYEAGAGLMNFNNDLPQVINHNHQSVGRLTISGGGEKRFLADITVESTLDLTDGVLVSENGAKIILLPGAIVTGGSNTSHVRGPVTRRGAGDWLFPVGTGSDYLPVVVRDVPGNVSVATLTLHEISIGEQPATEVDLDAVSARRYWELAWEVGGPASSKIVLPLNGELLPSEDPQFVVVAGSNTPTGPYRSLGQSEFFGNFSSGIVASSEPLLQYLAVGALVADRSITIYNGISPNGDNANDFMYINNIEFYPDNEVVILNRWGDQVYKTKGYNNSNNNFRGLTKSGDKLTAGTYYYIIDLKTAGIQKYHGYILIR